MGLCEGLPNVGLDVSTLSNLFFCYMDVNDFPIFDGGLFMAGFWPPTFVVPQFRTGALRHITPLSSSLPSASHQQIADPASSEQQEKVYNFILLKFQFTQSCYEEKQKMPG